MPESTQGSAREVIDATETDQLRSSLVLDERRRRPLYFDGRFLTARDLTREQNYFLTRQADLGRAGGFGVVQGLMVQRGDTATSLKIEAGHGVTTAGEMVLLPDPLALELVDVPTIQRLDATFGLLEVPREPARTRSGLFVVALRPVEFSANPIASYPTSVQGKRTVEDGEIIEATAVTLVPYPDEGAGLTMNQRRARVAREIFLAGGGQGLSPSLLPLAMVALNRGIVEWVDPFMVRREVGADHGDVLRLGFAPRALREAHLLQYDEHLREVMAGRGNLGMRFPASDYFQALPPAGRLPAAAIEPRDFTQIFFPPTVDVDLSIVPEDELVTLLEESLLLPPLDLTQSAEELDSTGILVLIPIPRTRLRTLSSRITSTIRSVRPATTWMVGRRRPLEVLQGLRIPGHFIPLPEPKEAEDAVWQQLLAAGSMLWYIRRRNLHFRPELAGQQQKLNAPEPQPLPTGDADEKKKAEAEMKALRKQLREAEERAAKSEARATEAEGRVQNAETRAAEAEARAARAEEQAREGRKALEQLQKRLETVEGRQNELEGRARTAEARAQEEARIRAAAEGQTRKLEEELLKLRDATRGLDRAEFDRLRRELTGAEKRTRELTEQLETTRGELTTARGDLTTARTQLQASQTQLTTLRQDLDQVRGELGVAKGEIANLSTSLELARKATRFNREIP